MFVRGQKSLGYFLIASPEQLAGLEGVDIFPLPKITRTSIQDGNRLEFLAREESESRPQEAQGKDHHHGRDRCTWDLGLEPETAAQLDGHFAVELRELRNDARSEGHVFGDSS